ncbi:MAG: TonB-dependent receptor [Bacteroidetes bacterium]|nr:TonB-dependent receptor [Bacteroidota bacterium]
MDRAFRIIVAFAFTLSTGFFLFSQSEIRVVGEYKEGIPYAKIDQPAINKFILTNINGTAKIQLNGNDTLIVSAFGYDTLQYVVKNTNRSLITISLFPKINELDEVSAYARRLADFDVGYLPPVKGVQIYSGTNTSIDLTKLSGAKSTGNPREIFAKVPGLNIWETDGAGIQIGIGGRGLSPNRTANFNTRQNGYDISADALGYPESYYTPPIEALKGIEIIRGSAALQFGTQFGGLLNFLIKDPVINTNFEFTTRNTVGGFGYLGTFNRVSGTQNRFSYQAYHQYKQGKGYRENSEFNQHQAFVQLGYYLTANSKIKLEYTRMSYLAHQAGGLSDVQFESNPKASYRERNWFQVKWNLLALLYDLDLSENTVFNVRAFGMLSSRESLGFLGKITQQDPGGNREMIYGQFKNAGAEARFLTKYQLFRAKKESKSHAAFLVGARYYQGQSSSLQGTATDGNGADFQFRNRSDLETSDFLYPSQNIALFTDNIFFLNPKWTVNAGVRAEYIASSSAGFYKQYVVHPINNDTLAIYKNRDSNEVIRTVPLFGFGSSYKLSKRTTAYANFTQNYRAINFTDIRVNNPNITIDTTIGDEYGYTAELGLRGLVKNYLLFDFAGFYVFYGDKIGLAPKPGTIQKERTNIGDAVNLGVESFIEFDFIQAFKDSSDNRLTVFSNVAYIYSRYIRSSEKAYENKQVEYVSPIIARFGIKFATPKWSSQFQVNYNSPQFADATNSVTPSGDAVIGLIPAYTVLDFSSRYQFSDFVGLEIGINNITDVSYFTRRASGYPGPGILPSDGRFVYATLQLQIKNKRK